ncbi:MAG: redoxin domain-containing protein [Firmicutes bacterium]|nr:redoxin domain-containing protein [Bacillota bacterium]
MQDRVPDFQAKGMVLLVVCRGSQEDLSFLGGKGLTILVDPKGRAFETYGVTGIPHTFFVDRDGVVRHQSIGWGDGSLEEFAGQVEELTKQPGGG